MSQITPSLLRILAIAGFVYFVSSKHYGIVVIGLISLGLGILYKEARERLGAKTFSDAVVRLNATIVADGGYGTVLSRFITDKLAQIKPYLTGDDNTFRPNLSVTRTWQLWTARFLLVSFGLFAFTQLGASEWFWRPWFCSFVLLLGGFHFLITNSQKEDYAGTRYWLLATWIGALVTWAYLLWLAASLAQRINWNGHSRTSVFGLIAVTTLAFLSGFAISTTSSSIRDRSVPWVNLFVGLTVFPFCIAWALASLSAAYVKPLFNGLPRDIPTEEMRKRELSLRSAWAQQPGWQKHGKTQLTIAVALSGGGYRAALIHAGVLQALDENCVPIRYLATVSGGSIVGAYYALGYTPHQFKDRLKRQKPGLPDQFLSVWTQARSWFGSSTNAETYADFFSRAFFGASVLADTGFAPQLLVNATDIERTANAREVFFRGRSHAFPGLDNTRLADVVAASAAFPGVFQPKTIVWPAPDGDHVLADRRFVDGGVVENLGYTGLERFLNITERPDLSPKPDYLIISDASAEGASGALPNTVDSWELLSRGQDIAYAFQVGLVHDLLDGKGNSDFLNQPLFVRAQEQDIRDALKNEWFSPSGSTAKISGTKIADEVTRYSTLAELDEDQVEKAFWLGHALGEIRARQIEQWRETFTTEPSCQSAHVLSGEVR